MPESTKQLIESAYQAVPLVSPSREEALGINPIPTFEEWQQQFSIQLAEDSPCTAQDLYEAIYSAGEIALIVEDNELKRYGKIAVMDVYYTNGKRTYKLAESRYKLQPGRTLEEFLAGDTTAVKPSAARPAPNSISERIAISGEKPQDAMVRAVVEELFEAQLTGPDDPKRDEISAIIDLKMHMANDGNPTRHERGRFAFGSSYQGIGSVHAQYDAQLVITPETAQKLPIQFDASGKPKSLYEYIPEKGYVNIFTWEVVEEVIPQDASTSRRST